MKKSLVVFILFVFFCLENSFSQNTFDIVLPRVNNDEKCERYLKIFESKPKGIRFSIEREGRDLYFNVNDKEWFNSLLQNSGDGLAVDVVVRDKYDCENESVQNDQIRGVLLKPVYAQKLKSDLKSVKEKNFRVFVGQIPEPFLNDELEYNILFLSNKNLCEYYWVYNLESYPWDLLDMGMYLDSLTYNNKQIKPVSQEREVLINKTLKFIIPFEKNKSEYNENDIKPIYDSLRLTDFNIKKIKIKAYSSVEGNLERNIELQQQRSNSIISALQKFQKPTIEMEISSSENWVEFLNDIKGTTHENLAQFSKSEIKAKLAGSLSSELEPILKNHRKAILELELEKKDKFKDMSANELLVKFNSLMDSEKLDEAIEIQNSIFDKLKNKEMSPEFLTKMDIPKQSKFVKIFNKNSAYRYMLNEREAVIVYNELLEIEKLAPKNAEIKYNIVAIKIKLWYNKWLEIDENQIKNQIQELNKYGINSSLISRMMVNFHIIKAENLMQERDYINKDKSVEYINNSYKELSLSDHDYLSLAQFFSYYANTDLSVILLEDKAASIDIDENLLFYYLNLTLMNKKLTSNSDYRTSMLNAININKERYCKLFNSIENGGVTFQLLADEYLRMTYCENCLNQKL